MEAALVNTLSPGDRVLMFETGHFATLWRTMAARFGLDVDFVPGDWRHGVDPDLVAERLSDDRERRIKAVLVVHNETSTGVASRIPLVRRAIDLAEHPALLMVDTISSLGSIDYRHDEWRVDVTVAGSQKGLDAPARAFVQRGLGQGVRGIAEQPPDAVLLGLVGHAQAQPDRLLPVHTGHESPVRAARGDRDARGGGIAERIRASRSPRRSRPSRRARVGLEILCANPQEYSNSLTAVVMPTGHDADRLREVILDRCDMSLGAGLGRLAGKVFASAILATSTT